MNAGLTQKQINLLKRAGKDPVFYDPRPLNEIMDDEIPYDRWEQEKKGKA